MKVIQETIQVHFAGALAKQCVGAAGTEGQELVSWGRGRRRNAEITCPYPQTQDILAPFPTSNHSRFLSRCPDSTPFLTPPFPPRLLRWPLAPVMPQPFVASGSLNSTRTAPLQSHSIPTALLGRGKLFVHQRWRGRTSTKASERLVSQPGRELRVSQPWTRSALQPVYTAPNNRLQTLAGRKLNRGEEESKE